MAGAVAPYFSIYGEPTRPLAADFLHIERVRDRIQLHGGNVEPHRHASLHQFCLWRGTPARYLLDGQLVAIVPPALTSVPPGAPHGFSLGETTNAIVVSTSRTFLTQATLGLPQLQLASILREPRMFALTPDVAAKLAAQFEALEDAYDRPGWSHAHIMEARLRLLVLEIAELAQGAMPSIGEPRRAAVITRFLDLVDEHFRERWTVARYAAALGVTRYQLNAATIDALERTPAAIIQFRNSHETRRLLLYTALSVAEIGFTLGYKDPAHFGRSFRQFTGHSPAAWRRMHG